MNRFVDGCSASGAKERGGRGENEHEVTRKGEAEVVRLRMTFAWSIDVLVIRILGMAEPLR